MVQAHPQAGWIRAALLAAMVACAPAAAQDVTVLLEASQAGGEPQRPVFDDDEYAELRAAMVSDQIESRGVSDAMVLEVMRRVPRHRFAPLVSARRAYRDAPQPIGYGQTISQPYIVAYMTERLALEADDRVLEVGTGSGYQAAILAEIVDEVVTIEIIRDLAESAAERLERMGYHNITVLHGDGYYGHEARAPFDAIIVTAAASHTPPSLVAQLRPGGRMVIPVGRSGWIQNLLLVEKDANGEVGTRNLASVRFVPLTGGH
ncbi:protein-L-isoaspartate O-methyltransferase [Litchfieldella qijiaojingensis]|uniref:Protein-L-isoaspartate O-methyltransferase n=1 Tax=Litchfieldella qijiaojingensis TaxID=980347 RepID=A0ABQ2YQP2_9GAMM|nr:protein-L-isoaspartate(D-aspartate) O-methyltransferase [Halomonas qijiaojingensis]GGX89461.1 protein-L-isoaspartate O-methyltransferase [Halomonas qijiaojingensis]